MFLPRLNSILVPAALLIALITPTPSIGAEPVRVVATGGRISWGLYTPSTANTTFRQRTPHKLGGPVAEMQIGFMNWWYPTGSGSETPNSNDVTIEHAWLERASTGQIVPITFSNSRRLVLPKNSTKAYWLSDAIPSSVWTGATPARDEVFWLHVHGIIPTNGKIPAGTPTTYPGSKLIAYPPAKDPNIYDIGGTIPTISNSTSYTSGLPLIFLGRFSESGHLAVIGIGDSIIDGTGDIADPVPAISGFGFLSRAAVDTNGANAIAIFNLTRHGQSANSWVTPSKQTRQAQFLRFANVVVEEYGTNDLQSNGSGDPATILGYLETIWSTARAAGVQKIIRTKFLPRTTSTNSWIDLANQTPFTGWAAGGKRDTINNGLQAALTNGKIDLLLNTLAAVAPPTDGNRWLTNGTSKYTTDDGTHPSPTGHALLASGLRAILLPLTVDTAEAGYNAWAAKTVWNGADSSSGADPNADGTSNLLAYASDLAPLDWASTAMLPQTQFDSVTAGGPWLSIEYRENSIAPGIVFQVQTSTDLVSWSNLTVDGTNVISEIASQDPDGDGSAILRRIRMKVTAGETRRFLRLKVIR